MRNVVFPAFAVSVVVSGLILGCGDSANTTANTGGSTSTTSANGGSGGTSAGGSGGTATGGSGGSGGGTTATGGTGGTTNSMSTTTSMTGTGGGMAAGHLLINEISVTPEGGEFIEIFNPTNGDIDLTDYYLSDNSTYVNVASGKAWEPITNNAGTDFLARFPANAVIVAGGYRVIATDPGYEMQYLGCPDYFLGMDALPCGGANIPMMVATELDSITNMSNLSNMREMLVLFTWSGNINDVLKDVDYVTWGATFEAGTRVDKTAVAGYKPDTAPDLQKAAPAPGTLQSIERCAGEVGEKTTGGNGVSGHDETSEDLGASFKVTSSATPGVANGCP